jgi:hypothetical protein
MGRISRKKKSWFCFSFQRDLNMMISKENCMALILERFPGFQPYWDAYKSDGEKTTLWGEMCEFSYYVKHLLIDETTDPSSIKGIFSYIEYLLDNGDEDVQNAACTCFLENILNVTPTDIHPERFVGYLGPKSRKYCIAWDKFTGVRTEGLIPPLNHRLKILLVKIFSGFFSRTD